MDESTFNRIYKQYNAMVLRRCLYILKNKESALDAMQDVFISIVTGKIPTIVFSWGSYLFKTATNICLNIIRKKHNVLANFDVMQPIEEKGNMEEEFIDKIALAELEKSLDKKNKIIMVLHYKHKMKLAEIEEIIGISVSAIKKRLSKIRKPALLIKEKYYVSWFTVKHLPVSLECIWLDR